VDVEPGSKETPFHADLTNAFLKYLRDLSRLIESTNCAVELRPLLAQSGHGLVHRTSAFGGKEDIAIAQQNVR
jgi:hypothetical protein